MAPWRRVCVMGIAGAGKSTLAARIAVAIQAPVCHLDAIYWRTGSPAEPDAFRDELRPLLAQQRWVLDGNYAASGGLDERLARADAVVYLQVGRWTALRRVLWRAARSRGPSEHGNPGGVSWEFIRWLWSWPRQHAQLPDTLRQGLGAKPLIVLRGRADVEALLAELGRRPVRAT